MLVMALSNSPRAADITQSRSSASLFDNTQLQCHYERERVSLMSMRVEHLHYAGRAVNSVGSNQ